MDRLSEPKHFLGVPNLAEVAALVGDPSRANMSSALMDGRALTAGELGYIAGVSPGTASEHLAKLTAGHLVAMERQGRHKYFRLASPLVGRMLKGLLAVGCRWAGPISPVIATRCVHARGEACYDHLAGRVAVDVTGFLVQSRYAVLV
jgi:DNA-binding transcriptional ArsR family regulator